MFKRNLSIVTTLLLLSISGGVQADGQVADAQLGVTSIQFYPKVDYGHILLTVAGNGVYEQKTFEPGESISSNTQLDDGNYKYEIVALPKKDDEAWASAAGNDAEEKVLYEQESAQTFYQSGGFRVVMGQIKEPDESDESN